MNRTEYGFVIVDKTSLEAGVLVVMHFIPLDSPPTPQKAKEYLETLTKDEQFNKLVKDTDAVPMVLPTLGLIVDLFSEYVELQQQVPLAQPMENKSNLIMPGDINKPYQTQVPQSAEIILRSLQQGGQQVII